MVRIYCLHSLDCPLFSPGHGQPDIERLSLLEPITLASNGPGICRSSPGTNKVLIPAVVRVKIAISTGHYKVYITTELHWVIIIREGGSAAADNKCAPSPMGVAYGSWTHDRIGITPHVGSVLRRDRG